MYVSKRDYEGVILPATVQESYKSSRFLVNRARSDFLGKSTSVEIGRESLRPLV